VRHIVEMIIAGHLQRETMARVYWSLLVATSAVGRLLGSLLMAKPNSTSCISGTPSIMAKVMRSRRIWMNSLISKRAEPGEGKQAVHAMLSFDPDMNWMKTSSRLVSPGVDGHALMLLRDIGERGFELLLVGADDMQGRAERRHLLDAGPAVQRLATRSRCGPWTTNVVSPAFFTTSATVPVASILP
jgi:hypothetical protein